MTTYILAGGNDRSYEEYGHKLAGVVQGFVEHPKILSCFFAKDKNDWSEASDNWSAWVNAHFGDAAEHRATTLESFEKDTVWADVVYFHGGNTLMLTTAMQVFNDIEKMFKGKIIIGSSAGSNFLSDTYYSPSRDTVERGRGVINFAVISHYGAEGDGDVLLDNTGWQDIIRRTKDTSGGEQILLIPEGTFVTIIK